MEVEKMKMKIILLGESGVGKTALLYRFKTGTFDDNLPQTLQPDLHTKEIVVDDIPIKVTLWDTAGQERYRSLATSYFKDVEGVLLLYDVTNMNSFMALSSWVHTMREYNEDAPILLVGNKNEEHARRKQVTLTVVRNSAFERNFDNIEVSAKTGENVEEAFQCLIRKIFMAKRAATAKKVSAQGFSYLTEKDDNKVDNKDDNKNDNKDDVIKLTKDAIIQTERPSESSWCSC